MRPETLEILPTILVTAIVVVCIVSIFGFTVRPKTSRTEKASAPPPRAFEGAIEHEMTTSEERSHVDQASFRKLANERLEPLLNALVDRAHAHHCEARYEAVVEAEATKYRLEVKRPDHPVGQPLPYMTFSAGDDDHVDVVYGGVFPGPSDHNRQDPEIGWRTVRWDQVDDVIVTFTHKVFARFD
ncbi:hypothetical protein [Caulobacter segnis]|uniref:hypothetical protein n=1 Tax=Caulobacter segnis TaxID=88688 RepID=UPI001CBE5D68|nr:hypothetical protein [Caulobacter segnis]UAL10136.1 hypothetical protein K8940_20600 [Caulobacter segnis]